MNSETSSAGRVHQLKVKALKEQDEQQARQEYLKCEAIQREIGDLHAELARKARIAEIEREIAEMSSSQETSVRSISSVESFTEESR